MMAGEAERGRRLLAEIAAETNADAAAGVCCDHHEGWTEALLRFGRAMSRQDDAEPYEAAGADLAAFLLSDRPLDRAQRRDLALLVLGAWRRAPQKPAMHGSHPKAVEVAAAYAEACAAPGAKKEAVKVAVAQRFGVSRATVENYVRAVIKTGRTFP